MLKYRNAEGRTAPFLTCDRCHQPINEVELAGVVYRSQQAGAAEGVGDVLLAHKGECMDALEDQLGANYDGWEELYRFLSFITHNVKLKPKDISDALKVNRETGI